MNSTPTCAITSSAFPDVDAFALSSMRIKEALRGTAHIETTDGRFVRIPDPHDGLDPPYRFMTDVLKGKYDLNLAAPYRRQRETNSKRVRTAMRLLRDVSSTFTAGLWYPPELAFLFQHYRAHEISQFAGIDDPDYIVPDGRTVAELLKDFVVFLHAKAAEEGLPKKIRNYEGKIDKNLNRLNFWEQELFRRYARLTFVRLDLDYLAALVALDDIGDPSADLAFERLEHQAIYKSGETLEGHPLPAMRTGFKQVQTDRDKFFGSMKGKPSLFRHLVGYVWRIEYASKAGYHLHVVLAFDGAHVQKHEWLSDEIGRYWNKEITSGRGRFHSCNRAWKKDAPRYGIGVINWNDDELRANLRERVLPYLAKRRQRVLAVPYKGAKLMGSGIVHRDKEDARGRPRKARAAAQPPLSN